LPEQDNIQEPKNQKRTIGSLLKSFDEISFFNIDTIIKNIPYFLFLVAIGIFYIWNNHRGVEMERNIKQVNQEMMQHEFYYHATKDSLTQHGRQSAIADKVDTLQMQELTQPPYTIKRGGN